MKRSLRIFILCIIILLGFLLRVWPLQSAHWWDETSYLQNAEVIFSGRSNYDEFLIRPPLLSLLIAGAFLFYHSVYSAAILVALLSTLGVFFMYLLARDLYGDVAGLIASALFAFVPSLVVSGHWIMTEASAISLLVASLYFLFKSELKENKFLVLSGVFLGLAILMRFTSIIIGIIFGLYFLMNKFPWRVLIRRGFVWGLSIFGVLLPYLVWAQFRFGFFLTPFIRANVVVSDYNASTMFYFLVIPEYFSLILLFGILLFIFNVLRTLDWNVKEKFFVVWCVVFLLYLTLTPHKEPRYMLPLIVPFIILSSREFSFLFKSVFSRKANFKSVFYLFKVLVLIFVILLSVFSFQPSFETIKSPFLNKYISSEIIISNYLKSNSLEGDVVYVNSEFPVYAYYSGLDVRTMFNPKNDLVDKVLEKENGFVIFYVNRSSFENSENWLNNFSNLRFIKTFRTDGNEDVLIYSINAK